VAHNFYQTMTFIAMVLSKMQQFFS